MIAVSPVKQEYSPKRQHNIKYQFYPKRQIMKRNGNQQQYFLFMWKYTKSQELYLNTYFHFYPSFAPVSPYSGTNMYVINIHLNYVMCSSQGLIWANKL